MFNTGLGKYRAIVHGKHSLFISLPLVTAVGSNSGRCFSDLSGSVKTLISQDDDSLFLASLQHLLS